MIPSEANNKLCEFGARWRLDGDYLRCLGCARAEGRRPSPANCQVGRPMIASCDGEPFKHAEGCKQAKELHPWAELRALIAMMEAEGIGFQSVYNPLLKAYRDSTTGSQGLSNLLAAMRRAMAAARLPAGFVAVPDADNMTDEQAEAIAQVANVCGGIAYDIYRAAIDAAPRVAT